MRKTAITLGSLALVALAMGTTARLAAADAVYQALPFTQNWNNIALISVNDDWSGVPGIMGFRGDNITAASGVDPQTLLADDVPGVVDVNANQADPLAFFTGGVTEFELADPTVAIYGSGTADAPYLLLHLNTTGKQNIQVSYNLRDLEGAPGTDDATQQFALQYRVGGAGPYTNVPAAYVADATIGGLTQTIAVSVTLPAVCDNQALLQLRIMTTNALGNDEATGVDDISVTGSDIPAPVGMNLGWSNCGTGVATANRSFTCDDNAVSFSLVGSFKNGFDVADFVAVAAALDVSVAAPVLPAWFSFGPGGCREGEISTNNVPALAGCTNPYAGGGQGGGLVVEPGATPDRFRIRLQWARDLPAPLNGSVLNAGFVLGMSSANSVDEGFGFCSGCNVPACFVLNALEVYSLSQGRVRIIETPDVRNYAGWQGGTGNCPGATPSKNATWGQVKALYR